MRVSTDTDKQKVDLQHDALIAAGVDPRHIFGDRQSGGSKKRKGLEKCLSFLKEGDTLIVWKLDRLGRSLSHLIEIMNNLQGRGVSFVSLTEQMDTRSAIGELMFHIFGSLAQYEKSLIQERVRAGLSAAKARGRVGGRPRVISDEKLRAIQEALEGGMSKSAICRNFGIRKSTLYLALERDKG